jgi:hypothetical protein
MNKDLKIKESLLIEIMANGNAKMFDLALSMFDDDVIESEQLNIWDKASIKSIIDLLSHFKEEERLVRFQKIEKLAGSFVDKYMAASEKAESHTMHLISDHSMLKKGESYEWLINYLWQDDRVVSSAKKYYDKCSVHPIVNWVRNDNVELIKKEFNRSGVPINGLYYTATRGCLSGWLWQVVKSKEMVVALKDLGIDFQKSVYETEAAAAKRKPSNKEKVAGFAQWIIKNTKPSDLSQEKRSDKIEMLQSADVLCDSAKLKIALLGRDCTLVKPKVWVNGYQKDFELFKNNNAMDEYLLTEKRRSLIADDDGKFRHEGFDSFFAHLSGEMMSGNPQLWRVLLSKIEVPRAIELLIKNSEEVAEKLKDPDTRSDVIIEMLDMELHQLPPTFLSMVLNDDFWTAGKESLISRLAKVSCEVKDGDKGWKVALMWRHAVKFFQLNSDAIINQPVDVKNELLRAMLREQVSYVKNEKNKQISVVGVVRMEKQKSSPHKDLAIKTMQSLGDKCNLSKSELGGVFNCRSSTDFALLEKLRLDILCEITNVPKKESKKSI